MNRNALTLLFALLLTFSCTKEEVCKSDIADMTAEWGPVYWGNLFSDLENISTLHDISSLAVRINDVRTGGECATWNSENQIINPFPSHQMLLSSEEGMSMLPEKN